MTYRITKNIRESPKKIRTARIDGDKNSLKIVSINTRIDVHWSVKYIPSCFSRLNSTRLLFVFAINFDICPIYLSNQENENKHLGYIYTFIKSNHLKK